MSTTAANAKDIVESLTQAGHTHVKVAVTDIDGILRGKYIHMDKFLSAVDKGFGFCDVVFGWDANDVCYDNTTYTGWHTGYPDAQVQLALSTLRHVPWDHGIPFFLGDFVDGAGQPLGVCPRQLLKTVLARAEGMGFHPMVGVEYEWFNFAETPQSLAEKQFTNIASLTPGMFGYSVVRAGQNREYFHALLDELAAFGVPLEGLHTETGPGVFEAAILASDALEAADRGVLFKTSVKEIAHRFGILPSFMAKWNTQLPGCSGHLHQSLWDRADETNVFYDEKAPFNMSETFRQYVAGLMHCLPELLPFFAPTVNSYKRLVEGVWAPTRVTWGVDNRTAAFRIIGGGPKSTRVEGRVTGADINPYLAIAASIAAGLYGIEHKLSLDAEPVRGNACEAMDALALSKNLLTATETLADSALARTLLGDTFVEHFVQSRMWEWRQFQDAVTNWELERYLEII